MDYASAIAALEALTDPTLEQIKNIVQQTNADIPEENSLLFYSGTIAEVDGESVEAWRVATDISRESPSISIIGDTDVGKLLNDDTFFQKLTEAFGGSESLAENEMNKAGGLWDVTSGRLASSASGKVVTLSSFADPDKVFLSTELPALLDNANVTHIDGIPREELKARFEANLAANKMTVSPGCGLAGQQRRDMKGRGRKLRIWTGGSAKRRTDDGVYL